MDSSVIRSFSYNKADRRLSVKFVTGRTYVYAEVPEEVAAGLAAAESKGRYFNDAVRDRYRFARVRRRTVSDHVDGLDANRSTEDGLELGASG